MKLGKTLFPILTTVSILPMTGLTSCKDNSIPFNFNPDIKNIKTEVNAEKGSYAGYNSLICSIGPITISKKKGEFLQTEKAWCYIGDSFVNYESIEGELPTFFNEYITWDSFDFSDGKYIVNMKYVFIFPGEFPESSFKLNYEWNYDFIFQFKLSTESVWEDYKIEDCILKGTIDYTPSEEK